MSLSPKIRLTRTLQKQKVDRPPAICTGGMMNAAVVEVMTSTGYTLPAGHHDARLMASLAGAVQAATGFENIGVPFCMTVEAEVLGSDIDFGTLACEPKIARENFLSTRQVVYRPLPELLKSGRIETVARAVELLARQHPEQPVIASLTGPLSTAASIVDPMQFLRELRKDAEHAHRVLDYVTEFLAAFARILIDSGAAVVAIGDPTATGEILGPKMFEAYAVPYLNRLTDSIRSAGAPAILHICGDLRSVRPLVPLLRADALSTDALVNLKLLKRDFPQLTTMGNLSTFLLEAGDPEKIVRQTVNLVRDGVDIIAPACGLSTASALTNIRALTGTVKKNREAMPVVEFLPAAIQVEVPAGTTVLQAARQAGLVIDAPCDGIGTCGKCKVRRRLGQTIASSSKVNHRLSAEEQAAGWILACQEEVAGNLRIELAAATEDGLRITSHGSAVAVALDPFVGKIHDATAGETMVVTAYAVLGREDGDTRAALFGLAVDIGTTTLVVALIDLHSGREMAVASSLNPQARHAQDVLSRIRFASNEAGLVQLQREVIAALNALIREVSQAAGIAAEQIYEAVFSGNTCMLHLAVGRNPAALGQYPYLPELRGACHYSARELDLCIAPFGLVYLPPIISAYVGADITSGLLATRLDRQQRTVLLIDIGTNGEMVLVHQGKLYATSTAAGPAFEGMNISCGMRAGTGAIERVTVNGAGEVELEVIGGGPARGLCGSGLLDAVAELVRTGVVTAAGGFTPRREELPVALQTRLTQREGKPVFALAGEIFLSRGDIRQVQLAKGAVRAGIELLLRSAGIVPAAVDEVLIAGAFGFHLRPESLLTIGLLPQEFSGRITFVGNTSKTGGQAFLVNQSCRGAMEELVKEIEVVELAVYVDFEQVFIASLGFVGAGSSLR